MERESTKIKDGNKLRFVCNPEGGQYLDTRVYFSTSGAEEGLLCWCSWPEKDAFAEEFFAVIDKYRI